MNSCCINCRAPIEITYNKEGKLCHDCSTGNYGGNITNKYIYWDLNIARREAEPDIYDINKDDSEDSIVYISHPYYDAYEDNE